MFQSERMSFVFRLAHYKPAKTSLPDRPLDDHAHRPAVVH
jgi:hypothetical protein